MNPFIEVILALMDATNRRAEEAYRNGYAMGHADGVNVAPTPAEHEVSAAAAYDDGYNHGYSAGEQAGYEDGVADSYDDGFEDGFVEGNLAATITAAEDAAFSEAPRAGVPEGQPWWANPVIN